MKTKSIEIQCLHCRQWFRSPIMFGSMESFDATQMSGNIVDCPSCGKVTACNADNMRLIAEGGGYRGNSTT